MNRRKEFTMKDIFNGIFFLTLLLLGVTVVGITSMIVLIHITETIMLILQ